MIKSTLSAIAFATLFSLPSQGAGVGEVTVLSDENTGIYLVKVNPREFNGAINNPLKGFRNYHKDGFGLLKRKYIRWNEIEVAAGDSVNRIIAHTNKITRENGKDFEQLNIKLVPRVYLDWAGKIGDANNPQQHWPKDLADFDYDSPQFHQRLRELISKLGQAWDNDPRIFAVQMGLIGKWGEHHSPAPTAVQRRLLTEEFQSAFKNKPILVRNTDPEYIEAGFGIYYDTFATVSREPPSGSKSQFPWRATYVYPHIWKRAPIEGEVEYNWQVQRQSADAEGTFGRTPDETLNTPKYRRYMEGKIRRYHTSYLGWIDEYDPEKKGVIEGAAELQKVFGYRFVKQEVTYPLHTKPGGEIEIGLKVRNTGSAPFYLDWPVGLALLHADTRKPVWSASLTGIDIRKWLPGENWNSQAFTYQKPAPTHHCKGMIILPKDIEQGEYILAFSILDKEGGNVPAVRFANQNYFEGGWHPVGRIGVGQKPDSPHLDDTTFDSPAFDKTLSYHVPKSIRDIKAPPIPKLKPVPVWKPDPDKELINPWRYWTLDTPSDNLEKELSYDGPIDTPGGRKVISAVGDFGDGSRLELSLEEGNKLPRGLYKVEFHIRGPKGHTAKFEVSDGWHGYTDETEIPLTGEWQQKVIEFKVEAPFKNESGIRFKLPKNASGQLDITATRMRKI